MYKLIGFTLIFLSLSTLSFSQTKNQVTGFTEDHQDILPFFENPNISNRDRYLVDYEIEGITEISDSTLLDNLSINPLLSQRSDTVDTEYIDSLTGNKIILYSRKKAFSRRNIKSGI